MGLLDRLLGRPSKNVPFAPGNPLEEALVRFHDQGGEIGEVLRTLVRGQVFVLVKGEPQKVLGGTGMIPLVVRTSRGFDAGAIFSSPERSTILAQANPDFGTGLQLEFRSFLRGVPAGVGLVLNPDFRFSLELSPDHLPAFREEVERGDYG